MRYAIACSQPAFWQILQQSAPELLAAASYCVDSPAELDELFLIPDAPPVEVIFFPHWSWKVPESLLQHCNCVCFHSAPVPYGRGGSPIQNMVLNGHEQTEVVALQMTFELDAGPVYLRQPVSLLGGGEEILRRIYSQVVAMMQQLVVGLPNTEPQQGEITCFARRKPDQSLLSFDDEPQSLFDKIRVLDIEGYPRAFAELGQYQLRFSHPVLRLDGSIDAHVVIVRKSDDA